MQLNPSEISELIKSRIQNMDAGAQMRTQGTVVSVTDGICRIHGLSDVMQGEMLEFPHGVFGIAPHPETAEAVRLAGRKLADLGHHVEETEISPGGVDLGPVTRDLFFFDFLNSLFELFGKFNFNLFDDSGNTRGDSRFENCCCAFFELFRKSFTR